MLDPEDIGSNHSNNPHIDDIIAERVSRRDFIAGSAAVAATGFLGGGLLASEGAEAAPLACPSPASINFQLGFTEVPVSTVDDVIVPPGYTAQVLAPWGTPLLPNAPEFREDASNTAAEQAMQVGFNHDGMHFFPNTRFPNTRGLLVINHEYTDADQIYTAAQGSTITPDANGQEKVAKALAGHGVSVIAITKGNSRWKVVKGEYYNRRITGNTPMAFSGPLRATHPKLQSTITPVPLGTLNNCAHGYTPWGTYLACEENWNGYFGTDDPNWTPSTLESRYGLSKTGFGYDWHKADSRFDLALNPNEPNRFGWEVEIDPFRPASRPVKRTAMGRFKHEGATWRESNGRIVFYMGCDENGEYLYKYVSARPWRTLIAEGRSPLDVGTLYVAKFNGDGTGLWLPLKFGSGALTVGNGWVDQADVVLRTRQAADAVGATKLHRPEWVAVHPRTLEGYVALTNGSGNSAPVNSGRDPNPYGHIMRFRDSDDNDLDFTWDIYLVAGDPAYDPAVPSDQPAFGSPDGLWFDPRGILWIQTDISNSSQNRSDRKYDGIGNNQMLAANPETGELKRFLTGPRGCEVTGVVMTPDLRTMFVNIQHPGESTNYWNNLNGAPSVSNPTAVSSWPFGGNRRPDVRKAFPLPEKKLEYLHWFLCHGVGEHDLWPFLTPAEQAAALEIASLSDSPWRAQLQALASAHAAPVVAARSKSPAGRHAQAAGTSPSAREPFGVNLVGYAYGQLGIGEDLRMTAQALKAADVPFAVVDFPPGAEVPVGDRSVARHVVEEGPYAINLFCLTALETGRFYAERGRRQFAGRYNIGYWPWELAQWPDDWGLTFGLVDEVWVSSTHIRDALQTARDPSFTKSLQVMPLVVEVPGAARLRAAATRRATREHHALPGTARLFCFAFDLNSSIHRKNPQAVVQAFQRAFPAGQYTATQVGLVVKVQPPRRPHRAWESLKRTAAQDRRIHIVEQSMPRPDLLALFAACDSFVSLHRAEGFGRGLAEALQLGLHLIATDYGGNTDFCRRPEFANQTSLVPWRWAAVRAGQYPYGEGQRWANPDVSAAAAAMRRFVEQPPPPAKVPRGGWSCFRAQELGQQYAARLREISKNG